MNIFRVFYLLFLAHKKTIAQWIIFTYHLSYKVVILRVIDFGLKVNQTRSSFPKYFSVSFNWNFDLCFDHFPGAHVRKKSYDNIIES